MHGNLVLYSQAFSPYRASNMQGAISQKACNSPLQVVWPWSRTPKAFIVIPSLGLATLQLFPSWYHQSFLHCSLVLLQSTFLLSHHSKLLAFRTTWYWGKRSIPRCAICCLQNPKWLTKPYTSIFEVGKARFRNLSFTLERMSRQSPDYWKSEKCTQMVGFWIS